MSRVLYTLTPTLFLYFKTEGLFSFDTFNLKKTHKRNEVRHTISGKYENE